jgi:hypothetical protein
MDYVGIDLHKKESQICSILSQDGQLRRVVDIKPLLGRVPWGVLGEHGIVAARS